MPKPKPARSEASKPARSDKDHVQSLERGLAVIRCLGTRPKLTLTQVAQASGMTRAAARRFLITLENLGYVGRSDGYVHLLPRTLELGYAFLSSQTVPQLVQPHLERLAHALQETCSVTVLDGESIRYIARVTTNRLVGPSLSVGSILPAYCTAAGRVLLAALSDPELDAYL
ncbi:MAG TPA: helix-turn-helix domain-containing protein, partial [Burkholderiales bacterium]|nr:helix-turn-helix domain-containing protein [Burkholderiales bacterium]